MIKTITEMRPLLIGAILTRAEARAADRFRKRHSLWRRILRRFAR